MSNASTEQLSQHYDFIAQVVARTSKGEDVPSLHVLAALPRIARTLHRMAEQDCSYDYSETEQAQRERKERRLLSKASEIVKPFGATVYHQGDPRGRSLYLIFAGDVPAGESVRGYYNRGVSVPF